MVGGAVNPSFRAKVFAPRWVCGASMRSALLAVVHQASNERSLMSGLLALKFHVLLTTQKSSSNLARSRSGLMAY